MSPLQREMIDLLPRLRRFARALTRSEPNADDLVQLTLERALQRGGQYRPCFRFENWMFGIMRHAWIDELRASRRRRSIMLPEDQGAEVRDEAGGQPLETIALRNAFARLPPDQRLAAALVLVEGLSYREAAEVAAVPEGTLTSRVARARAALVADLEGAGIADDR